MIPFGPPAYCPTATSPRIGQYGRGLGFKPELGQTFDQIFDWSPAVGDMVRLGFHGATAYLGLHVWSKETGFLSLFGLLLGIGQAVGAVCDVVSLVKRAAGTHPPERAGV